MNSIEIDTKQLALEIEKLKEIKSNLDEIFESIEKDTTALNDYWSSKASDTVQESFIDFYKKVEKTKNNIASDIAFLENVVKAKHEKEIEDEDKAITERLAAG